MLIVRNKTAIKYFNTENMSPRFLQWNFALVIYMLFYGTVIIEIKMNLKLAITVS